MSDGDSSEDEGDEEGKEFEQVSEDEGEHVVHNAEIEAVEPIKTDVVNEEQSHEISCEWNGFKTI